LFCRYIVERIKEENLENKINLILLSDHGMDTVTYDRIIYLDNYISNKTCKVEVTGPNAFINPNPGK
jgi:predicted AlkP superfamily pyrophosphatase or phosphodiesterase